MWRLKEKMGFGCLGVGEFVVFGFWVLEKDFRVR